MKLPSRLEIRVNDELVLDAGRWEDGPDCRIIRPAAMTMFEQLIDYLSEKPAPSDYPSPRAGEEAVAAAAVCLRWGSYLAVLADRDKRLWPEARSVGLSRIHDSEMARINIEASAALTHWIELMRSHPERCRRLVQAVLNHLPLTLRNTTIAREPDSLVTLAQPTMAARLTVQPSVLEKARVEVHAHPTRVLANAVINFCWRNGPVEDIHAGRLSTYPLMQRRITPSEERMLMREVSDRLAQGVIAISSLLCEKSGRSWPDRVLPFHLVPYWMVTPSNWSMEQQTSEIRLPGREPSINTQAGDSNSDTQKCGGPKKVKP
jgi:hypothetical protein